MNGVKIPKLYVFFIALAGIALILINTNREALVSYLGEYAAGTLQGFAIAVIAVTVNIGYQEGKRIKDTQDKRHNLLCGIYCELTEISEYLQGMFPKKDEATVYFLRPLPRTAWESAYISGLIDLEQEEYIKIHHIYSNLANFSYLANLLTDLSLRSSAAETETEPNPNIKAISGMMREIHSWLLPLTNKAIENLSKELYISAERFTATKEYIRKQMDQFKKERASKDDKS